MALRLRREAETLKKKREGIIAGLTLILTFVILSPIDDIAIISAFSDFLSALIIRM